MAKGTWGWLGFIIGVINKGKRAATMPDKQRIRLSNQQVTKGQQTSPDQSQQPQSLSQYSNPQSVGYGTGSMPMPRRAGQGQLYRQYVPAQGDEPPQLRHNLGEWQQPIDDNGTSAATQQPTRNKKQKATIIVLGIIAIVAVSLGGAIVLRTVIHPETEAGASTNEEDQSSFDMSAGNATDMLVSNKSATSDDMEMLTMLFPSLGDEYEVLHKSDPAVMDPDKVISQVSVSGWGDGIRGWTHLQLRVRASEYALNAIEEQYGNDYEIVSATIPDDTNGESQTPGSVSLVCRCVSGENAGITLNVTVGLTGSSPQVVANMDAVVSQKMGVLERLNSVIDTVPGLYVGDFALEGYTTPLVKEDGTVMRTETWWLYANSNVAPTDIDDFVIFVNTLLAAFQETAESDVANIDLTVISCDATDPAMQGKSFSDLATELAVTNDHGGFYMEFDYPLRGQATTTTPCRAEDLDGRLHPYEWDV